MIDYDVVSLAELLELRTENEISEIFKKFSCKEESDLEDFLNVRAIEYERNSKGKTFLCIDGGKYEKTGEIFVAAYYTLANTAIDLSDMGSNKKKRVMGDFPGRTERDTFPAFLIAQLGRCDAYSHEDISGETLLNECFHTLKEAAKIVGGKLVVLECREHMFDKVYKHLEFKKLADELTSDNLYMLYKRVDFYEI